MWGTLEFTAAASAIISRRRLPPRVAERAKRQSVLILNGEALTEFESELAAEKYEVVIRGIDELAFTIETGVVDLYETASNRHLSEFAFVQLASFSGPTGTLLNAIAAYLRHEQVCAVNTEGIDAPTTLLQYVRFAHARVPAPAARYLPPRFLVNAYSDLEEQFGRPFVLTALRGVGPRQDLLIRDELSFAESLHAHPTAYFLAREFIPADATYHLLVLGQEVPIVMRKEIIFGESHPVDISEREQISLIDAQALSPNARILAVQAASLMGLEVAEVRMVRHWVTGEWYVLDANATRPFNAGAFGRDKVSAYARYLRRTLGANAERSGVGHAPLTSVDKSSSTDGYTRRQRSSPMRPRDLIPLDRRRSLLGRVSRTLYCKRRGYF
jgi:glutathione synthase/RimK-type ligase-like ATP-grasp enzyme